MGRSLVRPTTMFSFTNTQHLLDLKHFSMNDSEPVDPNLIPVSPSGSALHRLSTYERAPSLPASESRSPQSSPRLPSEPVPTSEEIPSIPDYNSKSSKQLPLPPPPKKSKLSILAASRASSVTSQSQSSRSSGIALTGSVKTFPALRPSAQSAQPPNSTVSPSDPGEEGRESAEFSNRTSPAPSSTSSHVRRAIQTALNQEVDDQQGSSNHPSPPSRVSSDRSKTPTPSRPVAAVSKSAMPSFPESQLTRPPSKLLLLAQAKAEASKAPRLPKRTTEYLTPIANGSTVTTAITTSYQSLYSLTDPSRSQVIPKQYVVPLSHVAGPSDAKRSKLAMKIKKANEIQYTRPEEEEVVVPSAPPIFYPKPSRVRASPSAFASLLIDDILTTSQDKDKRGAVHFEAKVPRRREESDRTSALSGEDSHESHGNRTRRLKHTKTPDISPPNGFAFDSPSPDDIIFNARRGTSLGQRQDFPSTSTPRSPGKF